MNKNYVVLTSHTKKLISEVSKKLNNITDAIILTDLKTKKHSEQEIMSIFNLAEKYNINYDEELWNNYKCIKEALKKKIKRLSRN